MISISIPEYVDMLMKNNKGYDREELTSALEYSLRAKNEGEVCEVCGAPIWAAGSAISGSSLCFSCCTGEADDSEDYEII